MLDITHKVKIALDKPLSRIVVSIKQNDVNSRRIAFTLTENGIVYKLDNVRVAAVRGTKPDGNALYNDCLIRDNEIIYDITQQTITTTGTVELELVLFGQDYDEITSAHFQIEVTPQLFDDKFVESRSEYTILQSVISECVDEVAKAQSEVEKAHSEAEKAKESAEGIEEAEKRAEESAKIAEGHAKNAKASATKANDESNAAAMSAYSCRMYESDAQAARGYAETYANNAAKSADSARNNAQSASANREKVEEINREFELKSAEALQDVVNAADNAVNAIDTKKESIVNDINIKEQEFMASIPENYDEFKASIEAEFDQLVTIVGESEDVDLATEEELQEVFTSVSNGKRVIASAITDKGVPTESDATFQQMADNIKQITSGGGESFDIVSNIAATKDEIIKPLLLNYNCVDIASSTTLTCNLTSNVDGWCLATVTTRSDTTYPDGWTLLKEIHINNSPDQRMAMLCKQVQENEEISFTAIQSDSIRIYINLLVLDCNGFETNDGTEMVKRNADSTQNIVPKIYDKCVWCCSGVSWSSSYYWNIDGLVSIDIQPSNTPRQCNIIDFLDVNSRTIKGSANTSNTGFIIDSVKIL